MMNVCKKILGQSTVEFTFAMVVIMFLIFGMVMILRWAGMDLANRRVAQDSSLTTPVSAADLYPVGGGPGDPAIQLNGIAGENILPVAAVYHGEVANGNESQ